jgi:peroxiredoxin
MPSSYIIDRSGKVVFAHRGFRESDKETIENILEDLLSNRPLSAAPDKST